MRDLSDIIINFVQEITDLMDGIGLPPFTKEMLASVIGRCRIVVLDSIVSLNLSMFCRF